MPVSLRTLVLACVTLACVAALATVALHHRTGASNASARNPLRYSTIFVPDGKTLADCTQGRQHDLRCLRQAYGNLAEHRGGPKAIAAIEQQMASDPVIFQLCHPIMHFIGYGAYDHNHGAVARTMAQGTSTCSSGFYHGVLQRAFDGVPTSKVDAKVRTICNDPGLQSTPVARGECAHGVGHGLMVQTGLDLAKTLHHCDQFPVAQQVGCQSGAFMENWQPSAGGHSKWIRASDFQYPCDAIATKYREQCYMQMPGRLMQQGGTYASVAQRCESQVAEPWRTTCGVSLGTNAYHNDPAHPQLMRRKCASTGALESACLFGVGESIATFQVHLEAAAVVCAGHASRLVAACGAAFGVALRNLYPAPAAHAAQCRRWLREGADACVGAASSVITPQQFA